MQERLSGRKNGNSNRSSQGEIERLLKLVGQQAYAAESNGKLLGIHILGPEATGLIGTATLALKTGLKVEQLSKCFQAHPSYPEGLQEAALNALKQAIHVIN